MTGKHIQIHPKFTQSATDWHTNTHNKVHKHTHTHKQGVSACKRKLTSLQTHLFTDIIYWYFPFTNNTKTHIYVRYTCIWIGTTLSRDIHLYVT